MTHRAAILLALLTLAVMAPVPGALADGVDKAQPAMAAPAADALPADVLGVTLQWIWFGDGAEQFDVDHPEHYTLQFSADGAVALQADCNRGRSDFTLGPHQQITLSPVAKTMMMCPEGSLDSRFVLALERVRTWFEKDGDFFLEVPLHSGTLRFRRETAD